MTPSAILERAAKAGYNGLVLADYKFNILDRMPDQYFKNVERLKKAAAEHQVEIIPCVFPIGYSDGVLVHDPNLAEGLPVKDAPFVARGGAAGPRPASPSGSSTATSRRPAATSSPASASRTIRARPRSPISEVEARRQDLVPHADCTTTAGNCRLNQKVKVRPWTCYRLLVLGEDQGPQAGRRVQAARRSGPAGGHLTFHEGAPEADQDWTQIEVVFNSLARRT